MNDVNSSSKLQSHLFVPLSCRGPMQDGIWKKVRRDNLIQSKGTKLNSMSTYDNKQDADTNSMSHVDTKPPRSEWYKDLSLADLQSTMIVSWGINVPLPLYGPVPYSIHQLCPHDLDQHDTRRLESDPQPRFRKHVEGAIQSRKDTEKELKKRELQREAREERQACSKRAKEQL
ncbi:hypothetical protein Moror_12210 [Moniliophthora roreri MCA 2997]|uniref:Uncharacterized protein n=1 Tax=Moniliophthora roreri (strain MCA 2997) TaxID=1381753 RepID=V2W6C8_MONRO|nr:hypothetical protein Moror_12210 [Moniliophthora roreri MCA 2997]